MGLSGWNGAIETGSAAHCNHNFRLSSFRSGPGDPTLTFLEFVSNTPWLVTVSRGEKLQPCKRETADKCQNAFRTLCGKVLSFHAMGSSINVEMPYVAAGIGKQGKRQAVGVNQRVNSVRSSVSQLLVVNFVRYLVHFGLGPTSNLDH